MKVEPFLLVSTINVVIAQRLIRKLSGSKTKYFLAKEEIESLGSIVNLDRMMDFLVMEKIIEKKTTWDKIPFYKPKPSNEAEDGYASRLGILEVLKVTPTIKNLIMKNATSEEIEEQAKSDGMMTMIEDGIFQAVQGVTTIEEVLRVITE
jgi:type II secretory ATPase GspE/PulE/Tfp pilus assembly ATPase PilB-like protein